MDGAPREAMTVSKRSAAGPMQSTRPSSDSGDSLTCECRQSQQSLGHVNLKTRELETAIWAHICHTDKSTTTELHVDAYADSGTGLWGPQLPQSAALCTQRSAYSHSMRKYLHGEGIEAADTGATNQEHHGCLEPRCRPWIAARQENPSSQRGSRERLGGQ